MYKEKEKGESVKSDKTDRAKIKAPYGDVRNDREMLARMKGEGKIKLGD